MSTNGKIVIYNLNVNLDVVEPDGSQCFHFYRIFPTFTESRPYYLSLKCVRITEARFINFIVMQLD